MHARIIKAKDTNSFKYSIQDSTNPFHKLIDGLHTFRRFKFHEDWNWTIVLVNEILHACSSGYTFTKAACMLQSAFVECDIEKTYTCCVTCIEILANEKILEAELAEQINRL